MPERRVAREVTGEGAGDPLFAETNGPDNVGTVSVWMGQTETIDRWSWETWCWIIATSDNAGAFRE